MSARLAVAALGAGAALGVAAPAGAATWQPPRDVSRPTAFFASEHIGFDGAGNTVAWWVGNAGKRSFADPTGGIGPFVARVAVRPRGSDDWRGERRFPFLSAFAPFGNQRGYGIKEVVTRTLVTVRAATFTLAGKRLRSQTLQVATRIDSVPSLSVNRRGDAVVAWTGRVGGKQRIFAALARRGGRFDAPVAVSGVSPLGRPVTAIGAGGDAVVAWPRRRSTVEAVVAPDARRFGRLQRVGSTRNGNEIAVAAGSQGAVAIAWTSQPFEGGDGGMPTGDAILRVSYAAPGARFELRGSPAKGAEVASPRVAFDSNRNATVVWRDGRAIRASELRPASLTPAADVAPAGAQPVDIQALSAGAAGRAIVLWREGALAVSPSPLVLRSAFRPGIDSPFEPPETVAPTSEEITGGTLALDPATGEATALWVRQLGAASGSVVRSSVRK